MRGRSGAEQCAPFRCDCGPISPSWNRKKQEIILSFHKLLCRKSQQSNGLHTYAHIHSNSGFLLINVWVWMSLGLSYVLSVPPCVSYHFPLSVAKLLPWSRFPWDCMTFGQLWFDQLTKKTWRLLGMIFGSKKLYIHITHLNWKL